MNQDESGCVFGLFHMRRSVFPGERSVFSSNLIVFMHPAIKKEMHLFRLLRVWREAGHAELPVESN